ncbi:MAG: transcription termination factor Rho [Verrucomicrobiota bacterium]
MDEGTPTLAINTQTLPARVDLDGLHTTPLAILFETARELGLRHTPERSRHQLVFDIVKFYATKGVPVFADGILELSAENNGFLRWPRFNFRSCSEDVYVPQQFVKAKSLRNGNRVAARIRAPRDREKFMTVEEITEIEGVPAADWVEPKDFEELTPLFPNERIILENTVTGSLSSRAVDLITPLGRGQRALIVAPPRTGKTILLKEIAKSILVNSPESHLILLLVDERPEEVTDIRREVQADIYSSTFDESPTRHVQVSELVCDRAKRLVEMKKHVIILLDSMTRMARGYNALQPGKGRVMSGGVESKALLKPKKFFGSARNVEEGGSLTIIATALTETESRMDQVIFEEFKGTGNMELHLDRSLVEKRIYPAIHILNSGTRREELLYHPDELERIQVLRKQLAQLPAEEAMEVLLKNLRATHTNAELLLAGLR